MDHPNIELALAHQAMRRDEAAAARRTGALRSPRGARRLLVAPTLSRRLMRRAAAVT